MAYGDADVDGSNSTAIRIKSADDRGGVVQNVQYSNSCFANHGTQIQFNTLYNTTAGTLTPNFKNILMQNLHFLSGLTAPGVTSPVATGSVSIQGASNNGVVNPITVQLDNVTMDTAPTVRFPEYPIGYLRGADHTRTWGRFDHAGYAADCCERHRTET